MGDLATDTTTTARGRLRLPLRLRLTLTFCMVDTMDWDAVSTAVTTAATATTTARGRLRLPPRLRLTPTFCMVATVLATRDTTGDKLPTPLQDLNHRRKTLTLLSDVQNIASYITFFQFYFYGKMVFRSWLTPGLQILLEVYPQ